MAAAQDHDPRRHFHGQKPNKIKKIKSRPPGPANVSGVFVDDTIILKFSYGHQASWLWGDIKGDSADLDATKIMLVFKISKFFLMIFKKFLF